MAKNIHSYKTPRANALDETRIGFSFPTSAPYKDAIRLLRTIETELFDLTLKYNAIKSRLVIRDIDYEELDAILEINEGYFQFPRDTGLPVVENAIEYLVNDNICQVPPEGWYCTRPRNHKGPCAAHQKEYSP